jgi:putative transcriptional regulator
LTHLLYVKYNIYKVIYIIQKVVYKLPKGEAFVNVSKIKLARVAKNMTQQELADRIGVSRQTINLIEKDKYNPTIKLCISIAKALGKSLDELFMDEN